MQHDGNRRQLTVVMASNPQHALSSSLIHTHTHSYSRWTRGKPGTLVEVDGVSVALPRTLIMKRYARLVHCCYVIIINIYKFIFMSICVLESSSRWFSSVSLCRPTVVDPIGVGFWVIPINENEPAQHTSCHTLATGRTLAGEGDVWPSLTECVSRNVLRWIRQGRWKLSDMDSCRTNNSLELGTINRCRH